MFCSWKQQCVSINTETGNRYSVRWARATTPTSGRIDIAILPAGSWETWPGNSHYIDKFSGSVLARGMQFARLYMCALTFSTERHRPWDRNGMLWMRNKPEVYGFVSRPETPVLRDSANWKTDDDWTQILATTRCHWLTSDVHRHAACCFTD